jgi:hypothetical protein
VHKSFGPAKNAGKGPDILYDFGEVTGVPSTVEPFSTPGRWWRLGVYGAGIYEPKG